MANNLEALPAVLFEYDRATAFRGYVAKVCAALRAQQALPAGDDRRALACLLEDGRLLGKVLLDNYLAKVDVPQWMLAKACTSTWQR